MTTQPSIDFVSGVDRHGAKPPKGFPYRFAVLSWFDNDGGWAYPWSLFRAAIPRVAALAGTDSVMAEYWHRQWVGLLFRRFEETLVAEVAWEGLIDSSNESLNNQSFPDHFRFMTGGDAKLMAETEGWHIIGGPNPYHDSVTVSFFSAIPMGDELHRIFTEEATKLHILIGEITRAEPQR